ncbi:HvfC/BufC N-terminal domain-containing protein [Streptomyces halobius]|uniref:DNA-binding domain-containing protein n=1 Tax=Streptomyces halobius TaxID=2879846 RepID=A0ABY4M2J1_9ACTN|nr:DNA-binding domain-containing protein [Streptomyces halobius]UQA91984.1 DNA-binding domain-containing protein [Streptomyces halobius]
MTDVPCSLAAIQRWMQGALLAPGGAAQATEGAQTAQVAEVVAAPGRLTAEECFGIYYRGYRLRLLRCMRDQYPGMVRLLGRELFDRFALDYVDAHPSRSPSLDGLGAGFPGHLARTRPDAASDGAPREEWIDLLIDLARYERDFAAVLDGPEADGGAAPWTEPEPGSGADPGSGSGAGPNSGSGTRLFEAQFPVHRYAAAVRRGEDPEPPTAEPVFLALSCQNGTVVVHDRAESRYRTRQTAHRPSPAA